MFRTSSTLSLFQRSFQTLSRSTRSPFPLKLPPASSSIICTSRTFAMSASPRIVVHSFIEGIRENLQEKYGDVYELCTFVPTDAPISDEHQEAFRNAEIVLMDTDKLPPIMKSLEKVKWVQSTWAGVDNFIFHVDESLLPPKFVLTRFAGVFGPHMAEYVIGNIIALERHFKFIADAQVRKEWEIAELTRRGYTLLRGRTMAIIGAGDIGTEIGRVSKAFNMRVIGLVRRELPKEQRCPAFDEYRLSADLPHVLGEADFIVNVLPFTKQTVGLLSGDMLSNCKKKPVFINVGRGNVISEESIVNSIKEGWISHAILDVTDPEPLPKESPLWSMPEVTITPHVSSQSHAPEVLEVFVENYHRYLKGEPLHHQLDWNAKY